MVCSSPMPPGTLSTIRLFVSRVAEAAGASLSNASQMSRSFLFNVRSPSLIRLNQFIAYYKLLHPAAIPESKATASDGGDGILNRVRDRSKICRRRSQSLMVNEVDKFDLDAKRCTLRFRDEKLEEKVGVSSCRRYVYRCTSRSTSGWYQPWQSSSSF